MKPLPEGFRWREYRATAIQDVCIVEDTKWWKELLVFLLPPAVSGTDNAGYFGRPSSTVMKQPIEIYF